ncbi:LacI family transcriptional regulator [Brachybacterium sp. JHP9]|uniref:LacI family transcriptional regulator n=1 Tax=Brachybacterium equifaecis TaxID=2910770 RepID=A0ABT0R262_9MICO|nr:LacI family DNA-binding transcriptional regulator [Brachybacterium equifaecis]MCL6423834.1 LacI family transcriptional regulator [Brachybacterium equifaecis]
MSPNSPHPAPTLEAVARAAGVSRATASRVVRGDVHVTGPKADAVHRAVVDLGYVPNRAARSLVTRSTDAIALVVPESGDRIFSDPFFATAVAGITERLALIEKQLLLIMAGRGEGPDRIRRFVHGGHVDGMILLSHHEGDPLLEVLAEASVPMVHFGRPPAGRTALFADVDNTEGGRLAGRHLFSVGRRRLALISGSPDMGAAVDRRAGFLEVAATLGAEICAVEEGGFTLSGGEAAMDRLLRSGRSFDGLFAANDLMAIGALRRLHAAGVRVPDDVALIGFDDIAVAGDPINALTTIVNPVQRVGAATVELLLDAIAGVDRSPVIVRDLALRLRRTA